MRKVWWNREDTCRKMGSGFGFKASEARLFKRDTQCAIYAHEVDRATYNCKEVTGHEESIYE